MLPQATDAALRNPEHAPNSLNFQPQPGSLVLGQSLRRQDHDVPTATIPGNLQAPCGKIEYKTGVDDHRRDEMLPKQKQRSQPSS